MLNDTIVITFSGTPIHRGMQLDFHKRFAGHFYQGISYTYDWLENEGFVKDYWQMFKYEKYAGYFMWKPLIISATLNYKKNKNVLYCDSNLVFKDFAGFEKIYTETMKKESIFLIKHKPYLNKDWTKRDAFVLMDADNEKYWDAHQVWSVCMGFSQSWLSREFLTDYIFYCSNPQIVTELPNVCGREDFSGFREHRWEQSVVSILAEKYNIKGVWDTDLFPYIDKYYPHELNQYKEEINKDPLKLRN